MKRSSDERGVCLTWPGRVWRASPASESEAAPATLRVVERIGPEPDALRLVHGDGLEVVGSLANEGLRGKVDLVYVDPPYASERDYVAEARLDGPADGRALRSLAYEDRWTEERGGLGAYLEMLAPRLEALASLLSPCGTLWVHLDWRATYLVRVLLDEIFGRDAFLNEIIWRRAPNLGRQAASSQFGRTLDTLVVYGRPGAKLTPPTRLEPIEPKAIRWDEEGRPFTSAPRGDYTDASIEKLDAEGRVHRTATGRIYIKYFLVKDAEGRLCRERRVDALWTDVAPLRHASATERTGYPTQKPRALLERIIACATAPGALVVDAFGGSGTTGAAAHVLGRKAILIDRSPVAIATARARLLRDGASLSVERASTMDAALSSPKIATVDVRGECLTLVSPREPLAWVVGHEKDGVLHATWHSERVPGKKAVPALVEAPWSSDTTMRVRVYLDDGTMAVWPVETTLA
jgi:DNA modification methylase